MKFKATIEIVYDVNPDHYVDENGDHQDVEAMLDIDRPNLEEAPESFMDMGEVTVTLEEYKDADWAARNKKGE